MEGHLLITYHVPGAILDTADITPLNRQQPFEEGVIIPIFPGEETGSDWLGNMLSITQ